MRCSSTERLRTALLAAALALSACDRTPRGPVTIDLAARGVSVAAGRPVPLVIDLAPDGVRRVMQRPGEPLELHLRAPYDGRLTFVLDPGVPPDAVVVSVAVDDGAPAPQPVRAREGGGFEAPLGEAEEGALVRLVLGNPGATPIAWGDPRVVGTARARPPILAADLRRTERPLNVILVLVDALRADHLSLLGYHRPTTPVLARLAASHGVVFEQAYAPGPATPNSIPTLFTSRPASSLGVNFSATRARHDRTLAAAFDMGGFAAAAFVGNPLLLPGYGYAAGFGTYEIVSSELGMPHLVAAPTLVDRALEYLMVNRDASSFLYVHLMDTHTPFEPRPPHRDRFAGTGGPRPHTPARVIEGLEVLSIAPPGMAPLLGGGLSPDQVDPDRYDESIAMVDAELGRLVDGLGTLGLRDRTMIVITADHGEALGMEDDGRRLHGHSLYDELVHVPLVFLVPWVTGERRVTDVVGLIDVGPTLLDVVGAKVPESFMGRSLLAPQPPLEPPAALFERLEAQWSETQVLGARRYGVAEWGLREGRWKLILDQRRTRLFDLDADPKETRDVAAAHPAVVGYLAQRLGAGSPSLRGVAAPLVDPSADGPRLEEALRALGYIEP